MNMAKDTDEVITFMALFQKLRDRIADDPSVLEVLFQKLKDQVESEPFDSDEARERLFQEIKDGTYNIPNLIPNLLKKHLSGDEVVAQICYDLWEAGGSLAGNEMGQHRLFAAPVDPNFIKAWRNYETRYRPIFNDNDFSSVTGWHIQIANWQNADMNAEYNAEVIELAIKFAIKHAPNLAEDRFPDGVELQSMHSDAGDMGLIYEGSSAWENLAKQTAFDLRGIFRRQKLLPFVLIPRHVAQRHGDAEKISLYTNLKQAQEAFIFGVPFAALALMRSILEVTLKMHYHANGTDLKEMIDNCKNLPDRCSKKTLHKIRELVNVILHVDKKDKADLPDEPELLRLLYVLRTLIEGAPAMRR